MSGVLESTSANHANENSQRTVLLYDPCGDFKGGLLNYWPGDVGASTPLEQAGLTRANREQFDLGKQLVLLNGNCACRRAHKIRRESLGCIPRQSI